MVITWKSPDLQYQQLKLSYIKLGTPQEKAKYFTEAATITIFSKKMDTPQNIHMDSAPTVPAPVLGQPVVMVSLDTDTLIAAHQVL